MGIMYNEAINRLKEERCRLELSQKDMARYIHINQSNYSKVEQASRRLSYYELQYLCDTPVDVHYVFTGQRGNGLYLDLFQDCGYKEVVCYLNMIYSIAALRERQDTKGQWKGIYDKAKYVPFFESNHSSKNYLFVLRQALNWQQQKMAEKLGVDVKKLRDLENGRNMPDSELLCRLYEEFGIPPALILKDKKGVLSEITILLGMLDDTAEEKTYDFIRTIRNL